MRSPQLPLSLLLATPLVALALLAMTGGQFAGCGGGTEPTPLPLDTTGGCVRDSDCTPVACEVLQCRAGACVETAPFFDGDSDGEAAPPCGMDCNDDDRLIGPGQAELCDLIDQDCDGRIDEMAVPRVIVTEIASIDPLTRGAQWPSGMLISDASSTTGLAVRVLSFDGRVSLPTRIADRPAMATTTEVVSLGEGRVLVAMAVESQITLVEVMAGAERPEVVTQTVVMASVDATVSDIALAQVGSAWALVFDEAAMDGMIARRLFMPGYAEPVTVASLGTPRSPLDVIDAGEGRLAIIASELIVGFFDPSDGALLGMAESTTRLANGRPFASFAGEVLVFVQDAFDFSLTRLTFADGFGVPTRLPSSPMGGTLRLHELSDGRGLLTRLPGASTGVISWLLNPDLSLERSLGGLSGPDAGRSALSWSAVTSDDGTGVLTNYGRDGATLAVLGCEEGE